MNRKNMTKVLATFLAFILSFANVALLGSYVDKTYAAGNDLEGQATNIKKAEMEFDAYFQEEGESVHNKIINIGEENNKLYLKLKVEEGYLANGSIKIENANFKIEDASEEYDMIQSISSEENKIILNQINKDESVILEIPIKINAGSKFDVKELSKIASITLEGTYINNKGKEVKVEKTIETQTTIDGLTNSILNEEVSKYVTFNVNGNSGVILQTLITSKLEGNKLPTKSTKLEIEIPNINNIEPKEVTLSSRSLMATSGIGAKVFKKEDYKYENGKVTLIIKNNEDVLSWVKDVSDEIILTCIYDENAISDKADIDLKTKSTITYYGKELKEASAEVNKKVELTEKIGDIVTLDIELAEKTLYNGYMLEKMGNNTAFVDNIGLNIGYHELADKISFKDEVKYVDEKGNEYPSNALYTYSKISRENLIEVLGEDGYINIYNNSAKIIATLNKDNEEYKFDRENTGITFETSKPIAEGILKLENGREIRALEYSKVQEEMFTELKINLSANIQKDNNVIIKGNKITSVKLEKASTQAELKISNPNLSTVVTNEGVELRVTLKTTASNTMLYKNPEVNIILPSYITNVDIENVKLVYEKELKISSAKMYKNQSGNIVINIILEGEQTEYNNEAITEGATLIMNADITANSLTPTKTEKVLLNVKNKKTSEDITVSSDVKFIAPVGIATVSQITGYSDKNETAVSISGKTGVGEIDTNAPAKNANVRLIAINNYSYDCESVVILGRTPFEGNKGVISNKELGSTFTLDVVSGIKSENGLTDEQMSVYYSQNKEANKNLEDASNGWTSDINVLENINSYMIVLDDYKFESGDILGFDYTVEIPENVGMNEETYGVFAVYYEKAEEEQKNDLSAYSLNLTSELESTPVGLSTRAGADLSVVLSSNISGNIEEKDLIKYTAKITNNSNIATEGVFLNVEIPSNALFVSDNGTYIGGGDTKIVKIDVGTLNARETKNVEFTLRAGTYKNVTSGSSLDKLEVEDKNGEITTYQPKDGKIYAYSKNRTIIYDVLNGNKLVYNQGWPSEVYDLQKGKIYIYSSNGTRREINRVDFSDTQENAYTNYLEEYTEIVKCFVQTGSEGNNEQNKIKVKVTVGALGDSNSFESNEVENTITVATPKMQMELTTPNPKYVNKGVTMEYGLSVTKNVSDTFGNVVITCKLPEGLTFKEVNQGGSYDEASRTITWRFDKMDTPISITLRGIVEALPEGVYERPISVQFEGNGTCKDSNVSGKSNTLVVYSSAQGFALSQTSSISSGIISQGDEITYITSVKNLSPDRATFTITDHLPKELEFIKYSYTQNGEKTTSENSKGTNVNIPVTLNAGDTVVIYVTAKAKTIKESPKEITNRVTLTSSEIENLEANPITHTLIKNGGSGSDPNDPNNPNNPNNPNDPNNPNNPNDPNNPNNPNDPNGTYGISGTAWLDENKDGKRDDGEKLLSDIKVYLLDSKTNGIIAETKTNQNGAYIFSNLGKGSYIVAFEYDTNKYDLATYQADGTHESNNSDVINMNLTLRGIKGKYAVTNIITPNSNVYNMDLGLIDSPKFHLELSKSISLVQVSNSQGVKTYDFKDSDSAKIEIPEKYMKDSLIAITYKITVKNSGAVPGYVNKIVDYKPRDLNFSSTLNPEWYQDADGNLYNTSLNGRLINPGETAEVSIILTKTMTDENIGVSNNTAEIAESSNDLGLPDIGSVPGNKNMAEDDYGSADIIVTLKTGGVLFYGGIVLIVLAVFAFGAYEINKRVLMKI